MGNNVFEFDPNSKGDIYTTSSVVGIAILFTIIFVIIFYFILFFFYKGRRKTIIVIDKWIAKSGVLVEEPGDFERYIVVYQDYRGKPKKGRLAYCPEYVYDELEVGKMYIVFKRFKTIKDVYERVDS